MIVPGSGSNNRRHGRLACEGMQSSLGTVLDISASGLRVKCGRNGPASGDSIMVSLSGADSSVKFCAKVVWARRIGFRHQELGLEYIGMNDDVRRALLAIVRDATSTEMMRPMWEFMHRKAG